MTDKSSDSDHPNFHIPITSNASIPTYPNQNLHFTLPPSYDPSPRKKKRSRTIASSSSTPSPKPKYTKRTEPFASSNITRPCTECGKQFSSLKALFGHMRCHPERQWRGINPPPNHRGPTAAASSSSDWVSLMSQQDREVATSLLMLSNTIPPPLPSSSSSERFECGGCKKVFGSHQALGGHRASHKNVKGCFAITNVTDDAMMVTTTTTSSAQDHQGSVVTFPGNHKCNICFRVFPSGQALGGHMRCHWERDEETIAGGSLDLNVPAPMHDDLPTSDTTGCSLDLRLGL